MRKLIFYILLVFLSGCSYLGFYDYDKYVTSKQKNHRTKVEKKHYSSSNEDLQQIIKLQEYEIDSLYTIIKEKDFIVDSLKVSLELSNNRVAVNQDFMIPDSLVFADRVINLKNERIYEKFNTIYKRELRSAHRYIPRSGKYFSYFDSVFTEYSIPLDVKYLAIAESRLNPMAGSRVGALGIWQFMPKTGKGFGMKRNSFVDERKNVFKSTVAAAKYLNNAHRILSNNGANDWLLTMSSYNAGVGSILKVMRQQGAKDFFDLVLRVDETNKYVWKAAAIKLIMQNEEAIFGKKFELQKPILENHKLVKLNLKGHYKIDEWANARGSSLGEILKMNPWIKIYKRSRKNYSAINNVVLPPGKYLVLLPKMTQENKSEISRIEKRFLNKNAGFLTHHVVKKGDNLYDIAMKYKTSISKIKRINGLHSNVIYPNQKLKLYGNYSSSNYYVVKRGDTVSSIAYKLGISTNKLISSNNLKKNNNIVIILPGQKLFY